VRSAGLGDGELVVPVWVVGAGVGVGNPNKGLTGCQVLRQTRRRKEPRGGAAGSRLQRPVYPTASPRLFHCITFLILGKVQEEKRQWRFVWFQPSGPIWSHLALADDPCRVAASFLKNHRKTHVVERQWRFVWFQPSGPISCSCLASRSWWCSSGPSRRGCFLCPGGLSSVLWQPMGQ